MITDVHTRHCCASHGCFYSDENCTVTTGRALQEYLCESCEWDDERCRPVRAILDDLKNKYQSDLDISEGHDTMKVQGEPDKVYQILAELEQKFLAAGILYEPPKLQESDEDD